MGTPLLPPFYNSTSPYRETSSSLINPEFPPIYSIHTINFFIFRFSFLFLQLLLIFKPIHHQALPTLCLALLPSYTEFTTLPLPSAIWELTIPPKNTTYRKVTFLISYLTSLILPNNSLLKETPSAPFLPLTY